MCEDVDECVELGEEACVGGVCVNVIGSYRCECEEGTILDSTGRFCIGEFPIMSNLKNYNAVGNMIPDIRFNR